MLLFLGIAAFIYCLLANKTTYPESFVVLQINTEYSS